MYVLTGIDLCPANDTVYKCDFLSVCISDENSEAVFDPDDKMVLISLPVNSFEVVTMSLVLNYLPSPLHRELMVSKARELLLSPCTTSPHLAGLLLIVEKVSIFDGKSLKSPKNETSSAPSRQEWFSCICDLGFCLVTYQSHVYSGHPVHLFAFRVANKVASEGRLEEHDGKTRARMRIKTDLTSSKEDL